MKTTNIISILFACFASLLQGYAQDSVPIKLDSLFFLDGRIELVSISKNTSDVIECTYPGEEMLSVINKSELKKIVFKSGRVQFLTQEKPPVVLDKLYKVDGDTIQAKVKRVTNNSIEYSLPNEDFDIQISKILCKRIEFGSGRVQEFEGFVKVITSEEEWENVVITYNFEETEGLEYVTELSEVSGWGGTFASGVGYNDAVKKLKKEAAGKGCGLVLITNSPNERQVGRGAGVRVNAVAYRIPKKKYTFEEIKSNPELAKSLVKDYAEEEFEKLIDQYSGAIGQKFQHADNESEFEDALNDFNTLSYIFDQMRRKPMWVRRKLAILETVRDNAKRRIGIN